MFFRRKTETPKLVEIPRSGVPVAERHTAADHRAGPRNLVQLHFHISRARLGQFFLRQRLCGFLARFHACRRSIRALVHWLAGQLQRPRRLRILWYQFEVVHEQAGLHVSQAQSELVTQALLDLRKLQALSDPFRHFLFLCVVQIHSSSLFGGIGGVDSTHFSRSEIVSRGQTGFYKDNNPRGPWPHLCVSTVWGVSDVPEMLTRAELKLHCFGGSPTSPPTRLGAS